MDAIAGGVFITGTDTEVGKTVAAAAVLARLRQAGVDAVPMKPVQTGGVRRDGPWTSPDLDFCLRMADLSPDPDEYELMAPYVYEPACSPHLAAAKSGKPISLARIADAFAELRGRHECVVAEGAGGLLVPIDGDKTMLDLMARLDLPVILASRPTLGTLNHSLLSLRELRRVGLHVLGVIFCETTPTSWGEIEQDNWRTIERLGRTQILGRIPYMPGLQEGEVPPEAFRGTVTKHIDLPWVKRET